MSNVNYTWNFSPEEFARVARMCVFSALVFALFGMWIAFAVVCPGIIGFSTVSLIGSRRAKALAAAHPTYEPVNDPEFGIFKGYVCPTWDHNRIERELGGTDFTPCGNEECPACYPEDKPEQFPVLACPCCSEPYYMDTDSSGKLRPCNDCRAKEAESDWVTVGGFRVRRPIVAPAYAHGEWDNTYNHGSQFAKINWKWLDPASGNTYALSSSHPETWDMFREFGNSEYWHEKKSVQTRSLNEEYEEIMDASGKVIAEYRRRRPNKGYA